MTAVASTPHFTCRCPDGHIKQFCLGSIFQQDASCCGRECCAAARDVAGERDTGAPGESCPYCNGHTRRPAPSRTAHEASFTGTCCTKTLAAPKAATPSHGPARAGKDMTVAALVPAHAELSRSSPCEPTLFRADHQRPPPTDLITSLQRLVI
jgi:hypothetical protein